MKPLVETHPAETAREVERLDLERVPPGRHRFAVRLVDGPAGAIRVPALVLRGRPTPGPRAPVVGILAALHGNELNGVAAIHRFFRDLDPSAIRGTVVAAPIANLPGFLRRHRRYPDGTDLNRVMPGRATGAEGEAYAARLLERVLAPIDALVDLHTAGFGRINALHVRADLDDAPTAALAAAMGLGLLVHAPPADGTLRAAMRARRVPALTVELGDPQIFDEAAVEAGRRGLLAVLGQLGVLEGAPAAPPPAPPITCRRSRWLFADAGGLLRVFAGRGARVDKGQALAELTDGWGQRLRTYRAPFAGVVIGLRTDPVCRTGARILQLGEIA